VVLEKKTTFKPKVWEAIQFQPMKELQLISQLFRAHGGATHL